jgi:hypothetical protein
MTNDFCAFQLEQLEEVLSGVFVRSKAMLGESLWLELIEHFHFSWLKEVEQQNELFDEFVEFLQAMPEVEDLPDWLADLARFECVMWEVRANQTPPWGATQGQRDDLLARFDINSTLREAHFDWPVHQICAGFQPYEPMRTVLWVQRDASHELQVIEGDLFGTQLLELLRDGLTEQEALTSMARWLEHDAPETFIDEATSVVNRLIQEGVIQVANNEVK